MAAKLRIHLGATQSLAYGVPKLRIHLGAIQVLWKDEIFWGVDFITSSNIEADLTVGEPGIAPQIGRWTWPVNERLGWNTEILQSHDRTEQRIAKRRNIPDRRIGTRLFLEGDNACSQLDAIIHAWLKKTWRVPLWGEAERHVGLLSSGSSSLAIDTRYADFREGYALIWQNSENFEFVIVESLTDTALTLVDPTVNTYEGVKFILPVRLGHCIEASRAQRYPDAALAEIAWRIEDVQAVTGFVADMTYDGYTVLTEPSYLAGDHVPAVHDPDIAVLDAGTGPFEIVNNSDFNEVGQPHVWQPQTKRACWELRQFLHDVKGRQGAFLVPTFKRDLTITRPVGAAETSIYVQNADLIEMGLNTLRTYLAFRPAGSPIIPRKVTGIASVSDTEERIDLNTAPGVTFSPGETLCWVDRCRLASDEIDWQWDGIGKAAVETALIRVTG